VDLLPEAAYALGADGRVLAWNPALEELTGVPASVLLGACRREAARALWGADHPCLAELVLHPEALVTEPFRTLRREGDSLLLDSEPAELRGEQRLLSAKASPLRDSSGTPWAALETLRSLPRIDPEAPDRQEGARHRCDVLFEHNPEALLLIDPFDQECPNRILDCNSAACALYGLPKGRILGRSISTLSAEPTPSADRPSPWQQLARDAALTFRAEHLRADGFRLHLEVTGCTVELEGKRRALCVVRDITERLESERDQQEATERFATLFRYSPDAILLLDPWDQEVPMRIVDCNPMACELNGYPHEELVGQSINLLNYPPAPPETLLDDARWHYEHLKQEGSIRGDAQHRRQDGTLVDVEFASCLITVGGKELVLSIDRDVSERRRQEEQYREAAERFQVLFRNSPDGGLLMDPDDPEVPRRIVDCNPALCEMHGYTREELIGQPIDIFGPTDLATRQELRRRWNDRGRHPQARIHRFEVEHLHKDGRRLRVDVSACRVTLEGRDLMLSLERDITERHAAEQSYRELMGRFEVLFESSPDSIMLMDPHDPEVPLRILDCNPAACRISGYTREELLGQSVTAIEASPPSADEGRRRTEHALSVARSGEPLRGQALHRRKDGALRDIEYSVSLVTLGGKELLLGVDRDVTDLRRVEQAHQEATERFEALFANCPDGVILMDPFDPEVPLSIVDCNPAACEMNGYSRDELLGQSMHLLHPDRRPAKADLPAARAWAETLRQERVGRGQGVHLRKDGTPIQIDFSVCLVSLGGRELILGIDRDITQRQRIEEALREAAERFQTLFTHSPDAILLLDVEEPDRPAVIVDCNPAACELNGYAREEMIGQPITLLDVEPITPAAPRDFEVHPIPGSRGELSHLRFEAVHRHRSGKHLTLDVSACYLSVNGRRRLLSIERDVTQRRQQEKALQEAANRFETLFTNSPDAVLLLDPHDPEVPLRILDCNPMACKVNGYSREEMVGQPLDFLHERMNPPELTWEWAQYGVEQMRLHGLRRGGGRHKRKDGTLCDIEYSSCLITLEGRELVLTFDRDVTERQQAEQAYRDAMARFESLFSHSPDMILVYDPHDAERPGRIVDCNPAACTMNGYAREEFLELTIVDLDPSWLAHEHLQDDMLALLGRLREEGIVRGASTHLRRDGSEYEIEYAICPVTVGGRELILGIDRDVTERRLAEQQRLEATARFETLFRNSPDMVVLYDPRDPETPGRIVDCNPATCLYNGYSREELVGRPISLLDSGWAPETRAGERMLEFLDQILQEGPARGASTHRRKDGSVYEIEYAACPVSLGGRDLILGIDRDITEHKRLEEELRQSQKMEAVGRLAGGVAHDFNNLLTAILGYADLLESSLPEGSAPARSAGEIRKAGERAADLTHQLLAFSRRQLLEPRVLDLNGIVADMDRMLQRLIGEDIELETILRPDLDSVLVDPGQISQVLLNLAINARDAMPMGGKLTIETANVVLGEEYTLRHPDSTTGPHVMVAVSDSGSGIPEEVLPHIFEPFYTTKERGKGTGLGLSTVYGIVRQSGGTVWVYSEVGRGTTFKVYLPSANRSDSASSSEPALEARGGCETVLVVEDEEVVRALVRHVLEAQGYRVLIASTPSEALELAAEGDPHLVLTDVVMPEMNGRELATHLVGADPRLKVLYMSGYTENAIVHHGVLEEGVSFLQKPFRPETLAAKVRAVLDGS
jgi:PAS domain S-box-containing protein